MASSEKKSTTTAFSPDEIRRRRRERILIFVIIGIVSLLAFTLNRKLYFTSELPLSNQILIFILININLLLLLLLIFLVFRNLVKLMYDRKRKVLGAKLRTRLVMSFVTLTLLPTVVLFFFSIKFITSSIEFWFNVPVEQALENSLQVGHSIYQSVEHDQRSLIERIAYEIEKKNYLDPEKKKRLDNYIQVVQRMYNLGAIEIYSANTQRVTYALSQELEPAPFEALAAGEFQKTAQNEGVHSLTTTTYDSGELLRTICTVPFNTPFIKTDGFVVISHYLTPDFSEKMSAIKKGYEEYQQITLLKQPIQAFYYLTLSIVGLLVVFCAVWLGFYLAKTITIPIMRLAEGTRRVAEGDLSFALDIQADDEISSLVSAFNKMTHDLRISREQLELSAQVLREQNIEIEARRRYMEIILKNVSAGVISLDAEGGVTMLNKSAERMLNLHSGEFVTKNFKELLPDPQRRLFGDILQSLADTRQEILEIPLRLSIDGRPRSFLAYINLLHDEAGQQMGVVMVIDDLTELEKAQRMAAWREVARRIAHEVKNPLTPISLSAQRLRRRYSQQINEPVFDECTQMIISHVELIRNLVNEFSAFARFPTADLKPCELPPLIEEAVALYREGHPEVDFQIRIQDIIPTMSLDRQQMKQAMINLIDNAITAIRSKGHISIDVSHDAILKMVRIEVADDGVGISEDDKIRLFEPNFSTKKAGMGLGLTIVNSIITDHNGRISVRDNNPCGAKFVIEMPV